MLATVWALTQWKPIHPLHLLAFQLLEPPGSILMPGDHGTFAMPKLLNPASPTRPISVPLPQPQRTNGQDPPTGFMRPLSDTQQNRLGVATSKIQSDWLFRRQPLGRARWLEMGSFLAYTETSAPRSEPETFGKGNPKVHCRVRKAPKQCGAAAWAHGADASPRNSRRSDHRHHARRSSDQHGIQPGANS